MVKKIELAIVLSINCEFQIKITFNSLKRKFFFCNCYSWLKMKEIYIKKILLSILNLKKWISSYFKNKWSKELYFFL